MGMLTWTRSLDLDSLLEEAEQSSQSWAGLLQYYRGPYPPACVKPSASRDVLCPWVGFRGSTALSGAPLFLSTEKYHHHVGSTSEWRDAPRPPKHSAGLDYFTLVFPSQERLEQAVFDLSCIGAYVENVDGKHFVEDPSGNGIVLTAVS